MGHNQSPINITDPEPADLPELKFDYKAVPLSIIDNGHTIMINYAPYQVGSQREPDITQDSVMTSRA
jgi:carbonic anhydrase